MRFQPNAGDPAGTGAFVYSTAVATAAADATAKVNAAAGWIEGDTTNVRYVSPTGGGTGTAPTSCQTLAQANTSAVDGDTLLLQAGDYAGIGAIGTGVKRLDVRPMAGVDPTAVRLTSSEMVPAPGNTGTLVHDGRKISALIGTSGSPEFWQLHTPADWKADRTKLGFVFVHGANSSQTQSASAAFAGIRAVVDAIVGAGYPILSVHAGGTQWGNATSDGHITDAVAYLHNTVKTYPGIVGLFGASMGALACQNWARANLAATALLVGMTPVSDLSDIHTNNRGGLTTSINSAYGGAYSEGVYGATRNPATYAAADLAGLRYLGYYGTADTTVIPGTVTAVAAAIGPTATAIAVPGTHGGALSNVPPADVVGWVHRYATRAVLGI